MMTVRPRHALRSEPVIPWPRHGDPGRRAHQGEPPAGLGPWVPPLPGPQPGLSWKVGALLATAVIVLVAGTVTVVGTDVQQAATRQAVASVDSRYVDSVRANSTLTAVSDTDLVTAGHTVCTTLDAHPTRLGLFGSLDTLTDANGWSAGDAAAIVGSAVGVFCPEHRPLLG